jgi:succinoglycan biosynthesis protein ExoA
LNSLAAQDRRIQVFDNPHRIQASGLNLALSRARGRWVAQLDAHAVYPTDYIACGVQRLAKGDTRWVSGPMVPRGRGLVSRVVALALESRLGRGGSRKWGNVRIHDRREYEYELDSGVFSGVWTRAVLEEYGGWDECFRSNLDSELAGRFLARGERLVCVPAMAAAYAPRESLTRLWRQYQAYGEYRVKTARRHPHTLRQSHLLPPAMALDLLVAAVGPRRVRLAARAGVGLYAGALAVAGVQGASRAEQLIDAIVLPVVLATMHIANGVGMLLGIKRHGSPWAAFASLAGLHLLAESPTPGPEPVHAPSFKRAP